MCPSGKVKVFSAGAACFGDEAGTFDVGTPPVAGAAGAEAEGGGAVSVAVRSAVALTAMPEAAAGAPGCGPHPARTRLAAVPAMVAAVKNLARDECMV